MATVTGLTADRMLAIEASTVVDGDIIGGELILTKHDGSTVNAGPVLGPPGPEGPIGSDLDVLVQQAILDIGIPGQIRAGRELTLDDFTNIGLEAPIGLWNFNADFVDSSGHGHDLTHRGGTVVTSPGIDGIADTCIQLSGTNALYIDDTGVAGDPFRVKVGSFGAWVRTAKQGVIQSIITKRGAAGQIGYYLRISTANVANFGFSSTGTAVLEISSLSKICDDRWHFLVGTYDGILQSLYVDGILEAAALHGASGAEMIFGSNGPFNIGAYNANATTVGSESNFGLVDEAFVTSEILSTENVFNFYCKRIPHTLGQIPSGVSLNVFPGSKGASLLSGDFPVAPLRLYNFSAGSMGDEGSNAADLTKHGSPVSVSGVDGTKGNAYNLNGTNQSFTATPTGIPTGTAPVTVSTGCWVKCSNGTSDLMYILTWGLINGANDLGIYVVNGNLTFGNGPQAAITGPFISDGNWHFVVAVQEHDPVDGLTRKYYLDGRLVASAVPFSAFNLTGTDKFVIGSDLASHNYFIGQLDTVFVCDVALSFADISTLYTKSLIDHLPSPKNAGDHIQAMSDEDLLVVFDTLDITNKVSLKVMT